MIRLKSMVYSHDGGHGGNGPWAIDGGGSLGFLLEGPRNLLSLSCWSAKRLSALTSPMPGTRVMSLHPDLTEFVSYAPVCNTIKGTRQHPDSFRESPVR
jgi:hypothetical protein